MARPIKCALAQSNFCLGDIHHNSQTIINLSKKARDTHRADMIIFPELALTGYPPEDLLYRQECLRRVEQAIADICASVDDIYIIVGHPVAKDDKLYNAASVIYNGKLLTTYYKQHLPNYSVFDEKRYFTPGNKSCIFDVKGCQFALTICEDLWQPGPMSQAAAAGAECILCINASPFDQEKSDLRLTTIKKNQQVEAALPIVYVNCVGGQDELVFDGGSMCLDATGECIYRAPLFKETLDIIEISPGQPATITAQPLSPTPSYLSIIYQALMTGTRDYVIKNGFKGALIGLSGGIDSALTLAVAADALGTDNITAVLMPSRYTADISIEDAKKQCQALGVAYHILPIKTIFDATLHTLAEPFKGREVDTTEENIQARIRGMLLMALSNKTGDIVLTTGNKSEMAVGYATLYGDMAGGFAVLKDVKKTLVYQLAQYRNQQSAVIPERVITRAPSAELRADQTDQEFLPDYATLDAIMALYVEHNQSIDSIVAQGFAREDVKKVISLISKNEYKRRQAAPGIRITARAFGRDWRYPITSAYHKDIL